LTLAEVPPVAPHDVVGWKDTGVQEGVYRYLRLGRYPIEASLDLHRKTVAEAREALLDFVRRARRAGWRSVLISHGRGERSPTPARIKSYVTHWLEQIPEVIAFHSAERRHGGAGSVYVLLRKNQDAREKNRERHGLKGDT
jgi:DNA-nicking Smr family endonuclease